MDHYVDIRMRPNAEIAEQISMNEVFFRLHKALVEVGEGEIGVSFPQFATTLGNCLRVHGSRPSLTHLMALPWVKGVEDYASVSCIKLIPQGVSYKVVKRRQVKSSPERLMRRSLKRGSITQELAEEKFADCKAETTSLPYVRLKSLSTGQTFRLFVEQGPTVPDPVAGTFSAYGLSSTATVPWF